MSSMLTQTKESPVSIYQLSRTGREGSRGSKGEGRRVDTGKGKTVYQGRSRIKWAVPLVLIGGPESQIGLADLISSGKIGGLCRNKETMVNLT